ARSVRTTLDGTLLGEALGALEEQLGPFAPALLAARPCVATHGSDSPALGGTAAVVRDRRDVLDRLDLKTSGGQRLDRWFATRAGPLPLAGDALPPGAERPARGLLGSDGGRERGALLRPLDPGLARRAPRHGIAVRIGDRDGRVVERRADVRDALRFHDPLGL